MAETVKPDFEAARMFLAQASDKHAAGDEPGFLAARKLVAVALGITEQPPALNRKGKRAA